MNMFASTSTPIDMAVASFNNRKGRKAEDAEVYEEVQRQLEVRARHHDNVRAAKERIVAMIRATPGQTYGELRDAVIRAGIVVDGCPPGRLIGELEREEGCWVEREGGEKRFYAKPEEKRKGKQR